jgi:hypothetical protein
MLSTLGPRGRNGFGELFDPVLPDNPYAHLLWRIGGGDRQIYQLLRLEAPGLTLGKATLVDHEPKLYRTFVLDSLSLIRATRPLGSQPS